MTVKYYCSRCGKETDELYDIRIYLDYDEFSPYCSGLCKKCLKEVLKKLEKAIKEQGQMIK